VVVKERLVVVVVVLVDADEVRGRTEEANERVRAIEAMAVLGVMDLML